ncbi:MAG: methyltransferase domain-containing protein [Alphaproteobacteria bacterium]|nr:methyltransferase domain-containing protein [Alphaproteobacteria bacterium]
MSAVPSFSFNDRDNARNYCAGGPANFMPGFFLMHRLAVQLLSERAADGARVLVLGAGGGFELKAFCEARPGWRYVAVDPAGAMLDQAKEEIGTAASRVEWIEGYIDDAPAGPFDAATCLLTLHMMKDDGTKLAALKETRARLKPGAPFILVDNCVDAAAPDFRRQMDRYSQFAQDSGVAPDFVARARESVESAGTCVSGARNEELLREAGFGTIEGFYTALSWRGWVATA